MKPINKYVVDVNEYLNKQFQFFAHLKEDNITKDIKKETSYVLNILKKW